MPFGHDLHGIVEEPFDRASADAVLAGATLRSHSATASRSTGFRITLVNFARSSRTGGLGEFEALFGGSLFLVRTDEYDKAAEAQGRNPKNAFSYDPGIAGATPELPAKFKSLLNRVPTAKVISVGKGLVHFPLSEK